MTICQNDKSSPITKLHFADDTMPICGFDHGLLELLKQTKSQKKKEGFLSTRKTKVMVVDNNRTDFNDFLLKGDKIEEVEEFPYLGSVIDTNRRLWKRWRRLRRVSTSR